MRMTESHLKTKSKLIIPVLFVPQVEKKKLEHNYIYSHQLDKIKGYETNRSF